MGNYRFRLSDMMPNAWFYKLKDMAKTRRHSIPHPTNTTKKLQPTRTTACATATPLSHHRHSYYYSSDHPNRDKYHTSPTNLKASDTPFPDPPRKSKKKAKRRSSRSSSKLISSSVSAGCSCRTSFDSVWKPDASSLASFDSPPLLPNAGLDPTSAPAIVDALDSMSSWSSSCSCRVSSSATDIIIDVDSKNSFQRSKFDEFDSLLELELPPVLTKPAKLKQETETMQFTERFIELKERNGSGSVCVKVLKEGSSKTLKEDKSPARRFSSPAFHGLKMRANSPRLASKKIQAYNRKSTSMTATQRARRKSVSDSFAVVKSSLDPQRDFRESMVEMILENNIRASKDLEDLLACYLSLNSNEYHDLIVKVFEQIWFDLTDIQL